MTTVAVAKRHEVTDRVFKDIVAKEKAAETAKTARLKALRLAREQQEAADAASAAPAPKTKAASRRKAS